MTSNLLRLDRLARGNVERVREWWGGSGRGGGGGRRWWSGGRELGGGAPSEQLSHLPKTVGDATGQPIVRKSPGKQLGNALSLLP